MDNTNPTDGIGNSEFAGGANISWAPSLGLGETRTSTGGSGNELSFNADVEYSPPIGPSPPIEPISSPLPVEKCVVPNIKGETLKAARKRLKAAKCTLGKVKSKKTKSAKVKKQSPKPGKVLAAGAKISVKLEEQMSNRRRSAGA